MQNYKSKSYSTKPLENQIDKQLFSLDVWINGAKNFLFDTYENIYEIVKLKNSSFYEDHTYSTNIKLFIDIDHKVSFTSELERDKCSNELLNIIIPSINIKLLEIFQINNPSIIVLISDTLEKLSLHLIYPYIIFNNVDEMKSFTTDIQIIDKSVYKKGAFRMLYCSKLKKYNNLIFYKEYNYSKPNDDYLFFSSFIFGS